MRDEHISAVNGSGHFVSETQKRPQLQDFRILIFLKQEICWHRAFHVKKVSFPELTFSQWGKKKKSYKNPSNYLKYC